MVDENGRIEVETSLGTVYMIMAWEGEEARGRESAATGWQYQTQDGRSIGWAERRLGDERYVVTADSGTRLGTVEHDKDGAQVVADWWIAEGHQL